MTTGTTSFKELLLTLPDLADYPEMLGTIRRREASKTVPCWDYPTLACEAVGADPRLARPGVAAIFCLFNSILLVDDILDEDARGDYRRLGAGRAANMALAFQATAFRVIEESAANEDCRATVLRRMTRIAMDTAIGQDMDSVGVAAEAEYWRVVERKTPPLFGGAFHIGATLAGASQGIAQSLDEFGSLLAMVIQVSDDLKDAMDQSISPDWKRGAMNLAILYATIADHPERKKFIDLKSRGIVSLEALSRAQDILVRSGAASFCVYKMFEFYETAKKKLEDATLPLKASLEELLETSVNPARELLQSLGCTTQ